MQEGAYRADYFASHIYSYHEYQLASAMFPANTTWEPLRREPTHTLKASNTPAIAAYAWAAAAIP